MTKNALNKRVEDIFDGLKVSNTRFQIAAFAAKKYSFENVSEYKKPMVKKLPNMPNDIKLKDNY